MLRSLRYLFAIQNILGATYKYVIDTKVTIPSITAASNSLSITTFAQAQSLNLETAIQKEKEVVC